MESKPGWAGHEYNSSTTYRFLTLFYGRLEFIRFLLLFAFVSIFRVERNQRQAQIKFRQPMIQAK